MRARLPVVVEAIEPRRLLSADLSANDELLESQPSEAVVAEWRQPSIFWLRGDHIIASPSGRIDAGTDLARFEGLLPIDQYTVAVDWGDGTTSAGMLQRMGEKGYRVFGTHEYTTPGDYSARVQITASDGQRQFQYLRFLSYAQPLQLMHQSAFEEPQNDGTRLHYSIFFYPTLVSDIDAITATIDWGDGHVTQCRVSELWSGAMAGMFWHDYAAPGMYQVTFTATGPTYDGDVATLVMSKSVELLGHYPPSEPGEWAVLFGERLIGESDAEDAPAHAPPPGTTSTHDSRVIFASRAAATSIARTIFADDSALGAVE